MSIEQNIRMDAETSANIRPVESSSYTVNGGIPRTQFVSPWDTSFGQSSPAFSYFVAHALRGRSMYTPQMQQMPMPSYAARAQEESERSMRPHFRSKIVCVISCKHCHAQVCQRGMKAILLADMNVELYSTDFPPYAVQMVNDDYHTKNCACRIRDVACLGCGNVIGYHVTQPCETCMDACNNGHFWMFHCAETLGVERLNSSGPGPLLWSQIPKVDRDASILAQVIDGVQR